MEKDNYPDNSEKGFNLIEMLVAIAIFVTMVGAISGLFISGIRIQRRILATQELVNQASYLMEYMSRSLRMARKDLTGLCTDEYGKNYLTTGNDIIFLDYNKICTIFFLTSDGKIMKTDPISGAFNLTSSNILVNSFGVYLSGESQSDFIQPKVTLSLVLSSKAIADLPSIKIQTTISQRNLDFEY